MTDRVWKGAPDLEATLVPIDGLILLPGNPRHGDIPELMKSLDRFGQRKPIGVNEDGVIIAGNHTMQAARELGWTHVAVTGQGDLAPKEQRAYALADNRLSDLASYDNDALVEALREAAEDTQDGLTGLGYTPQQLTDLKVRVAYRDPEPLARDFGIPPFTLLDARQGYWQNRKRWWLDRGLTDEVGRTAFAINSKGLPGMSTRPSIFDPVLTEVAYRWFCPPGGHILDPFAGGPTRGVVAQQLGYRYTGIEIRQGQIDANESNAAHFGIDDPDMWLLGDSTYLGDIPPATIDDPDVITPIEEHGGVLMKRDDLFGIDGSVGGKVRTALHLADGAAGLVTAGSRQSPQVNIVATIAHRLGIPCRVHVPEAKGDLTPELQAAVDMGAEIVGHRPGHNNVIIARAREDAADRDGWVEIPFGMEDAYAVTATAHQVANVTDHAITRIVVPVGSGMSLAGILAGLDQIDVDIPVLGVTVGADPTDRLDKYAPEGWRDRVTLVPSGVDYHTPAEVTSLHGVPLDPIYEAKCVPHLAEGDLFWIVGRRATTTTSTAWQERIRAEAPYDMVWTCPPYYDLESYSGGDGDGSMHPTFAEFVVWYRAIVQSCYDLLGDNRFAAFVVGEVRGRDGGYHNFVGETIRAMMDAGFVYYNEAVLVTAVGTLPLRARQGMKTRKLGKTHQNVLVFYKGDPGTIRDHHPELGAADMGAPDDAEDDDVT